MPVPAEYQRATIDFDQFLADARDAAGLTTSHQAFTMAQGVMQVFRRRLDLGQAIRFLGVLPVGLRALFADGWDADEPTRRFEDRAAMTRGGPVSAAAPQFRPRHCHT